MACPDCFTGKQQDGTPAGRETTIHGRDTYVSEPLGGVSPRGIIVIVPDAFGWGFINNRLLADAYAAKGQFLVYLPDFMNGRAPEPWVMDVMGDITENFTLRGWIWKPWYVMQALYGMTPFLLTNRFKSAWPRIRSFFASVRGNEGVSIPVFAAGFCWGGKPVVTLTHADSSLTAADGRPARPLADAVFTGHPALLTLPADLEKVARPLSIAIGDGDIWMPLEEVGRAREILTAVGEEGVVAAEVVLYPGAGHGFCVRGDPKNANQVQQAKDAEDQAIVWFQKHTGL